MLAGQPFREFGVAPLERLDDFQMVDDGASGPIALRNGGTANGAHVTEQISRCIDDCLGAAKSDHGRMKRDIGIGIFIQMFRRRRILKLVEQMPQLRDFRVGSGQSRQPRRHGLERRPNLNHLDNFAFGLANDVNTAPRHRSNEAFLLQQSQGFANWRTANSQGGGQYPLVEPQLLVRVIYVGVGDCLFQQGIGLIPQAGGIQASQCQGRRGTMIAAPSPPSYSSFP